MPINPDAVDFAKQYGDVFNDNAVHESTLLAGEFAQLAKNKNTMYLDAGTIVPAGNDGLHLEQPGHHMLGMRIALKLSTTD